MATRADLIIVGAGLAGAATAWAASARGLDVVLLEQFGAGHKNGSSHGSARIFRYAYPDPFYVRLVAQAGELWRKLEGQAGQELLTITGGLDFGADRHPGRLHAALASCGVPAELLAEREAAERWPQFDFTGSGQVMFHPGAGVVEPDTAVAAMLRLAVASGADVRFNAPVSALTTGPGGEGAVARAGDDTVTAPVAVVAAGGWTTPLLDGLVVLPPLAVTQQQVFHFAPRQQPATPAATPWPVFIFRHGPDNIYGLPDARDGGTPGAVKIGEHDPGTATTAAARDFRIDPVSRDHVRGFAATRAPGLDPAVINETSCLYTWTANEDFILDRPAAAPGGSAGPFVVASPCSGHGAKFAPLLGEILTDLATGKPSPDGRFTLAAHLARH